MFTFINTFNSKEFIMNNDKKQSPTIINAKARIFNPGFADIIQIIIIKNRNKAKY